jgi:prepilin-type processing-associated H-X9-DG protein
LGAGLFIYANQNRDHLPNLNPPLTWVDYDGANKAMVNFATILPTAAIFHCPSDRDPVPDTIETADQSLPNSARVSYDFFSLYWAPELGPKMTDLEGLAPMAWDLEGGSKTPNEFQNHGTAGGNVLFADGHVDWNRLDQWEAGGWPAPATQFYPGP